MLVLIRSCVRTVIALAALAAFIVPTQNAFSAEYSRAFVIAEVAGVSISRVTHPGSASIFRIYASFAAPWGSSNCRPDAADLSIDDWHIYPIIMRAWKENLQVTVVVESSVRLDTTDAVCKIVAVNTSS